MVGSQGAGELRGALARRRQVGSLHRPTAGDADPRWPHRAARRATSWGARRRARSSGPPRSAALRHQRRPEHRPQPSDGWRSPPTAEWAWSTSATAPSSVTSDSAPASPRGWPSTRARPTLRGRWRAGSGAGARRRAAVGPEDGARKAVLWTVPVPPPAGFPLARPAADYGVNGRAGVELHSGPRALVLSASGERLYVLDRFTATVAVLEAVSTERAAPGPSDSSSSPVANQGQRRLGQVLYFADMGKSSMSCDACHLEGHEEGILFEKTHPCASTAAPPCAARARRRPTSPPRAPGVWPRPRGWWATGIATSTPRCPRARSSSSPPSAPPSPILPNPYRGPDGAPPASLALPGAAPDIRRAGMRLFEGKADCVRCHPPPHFTTDQDPTTRGQVHRRGDAAPASAARRTARGLLPRRGRAGADRRLGRLPHAHHRAGRVPASTATEWWSPSASRCGPSSSTTPRRRTERRRARASGTRRSPGLPPHPLTRVVWGANPPRSCCRPRGWGLQPSWEAARSPATSLRVSAWRVRCCGGQPKGAGACERNDFSRSWCLPSRLRGQSRSSPRTATTRNVSEPSVARRRSRAAVRLWLRLRLLGVGELHRRRQDAVLHRRRRR